MILSCGQTHRRTQSPHLLLVSRFICHINNLAVTSAAIAESSSSGVNMEYYLSLFKELALPDSLLDYVVGAIGRISDIISASGVQIVIFIAALQSIPSEENNQRHVNQNILQRCHESL